MKIRFLRSLFLSSILFGLTIAASLPGLAAVPPSPPSYNIRMENTWIPMKDGVRLAVTLYMPDGGKAGEKFPAVLEYHPYRKDDGTAERDYSLYAYFVRRGYVCARVDIRGFGSSEGTPTDREYSEQEQLDGLQIIAWLAHQSWSNGNVGMMGISWSGFNSLQMAMRHAPELKAIIAVDATAELFHDDVHYIDGMAHVDEFELNMDMAPGITGAPDYTLDEKFLTRASTLRPGLCFISNISTTARSGEVRCAHTAKSRFPAFSSAACSMAIATASPICCKKRKLR